MRKYTDEERQSFCYGRCYDCGLEYGGKRWCDVILDNDIWELINPTYHKGAGLLCFNCITGRLNELGLENVNIKITSGPYWDEERQKV